MPPRYFDLKAHLLSEIGKDPHARILSVTDDEITCLDTGGSGKRTTFRLAPRTRADVEKIVTFDPNIMGRQKMKNDVASRLASLDPRVLLTLRHVIVVDSTVGLFGLARSIDPADLPPSSLLDEKGVLGTETVGAYWPSQSAVIVNAKAVKRSVQELTEGQHRTSASMLQAGLRTGFYTALLYALRYGQIHGCPYPLPWLSDADKDHAAIARWAAATYGDWTLD